MKLALILVGYVVLVIGASLGISIVMWAADHECPAVYSHQIRTCEDACGHDWRGIHRGIRSVSPEGTCVCTDDTEYTRQEALKLKDKR